MENQVPKYVTQEVPRCCLGFRPSESELGHTVRAANQKETFCHGLFEQQARRFRLGGL
jgi:hypothetical protein